MATHLSRRNVLWIGGTAVAVTVGGAGVVAFTGGAAKVDLVVFGGTAAGIAAAVQARRMGRSVVVVEPSTHIGGMTSGGLGNTDLGINLSVGGIAREFYRRIYAKYTSITLTDTSPARFTFEPHVARSVLDDLLREADIPIHTGMRLRRVQKSGTRIVSIETENGSTYSARMFIDASYEGDLMDKAGVASIVGREANAAHGETINGVQLSTEQQHLLPISPYRTEGVKSSGLLPGISASAAPNGTGDDRIQAYNFRMCLTKSSDRRAFPKPSGYDPADYELLRRLIKAGYTGAFFNTIDIGGGKVDSNNSGPISTDFVGANYAFPMAGYAERDSITAEHLRYQQGLMWFLANDPDLPPWVRAQAGAWGLAPDEFQSTGGWPPQLYVREARRMRSDYVMTEHDCVGTTKAPDSVGMGSYMVDSHTCQRVVHDGQVANEGSVAVPVAQPYPISYRSIVPNAAQCTNLFVPVCLAATHVAYGSIRMEPVFMILAQSAATAAVLAMDADIDVQNLDYGTLVARLSKDGQILRWPADVHEVILDSAAPGVTRVGKWNSSTSVPGYYGVDYEHDANTGKGRTSIAFRPKLPGAATYTVYLRWSAGPDRASNVPVDIQHANGTSTVLVNQRQPSGEWAKLGTYPFAATGKESITLRTDGTDGIVIADAVRLVAN
jgi:hypothetical protein